nr:vegetative cell wall protein gp1-like [Danio rerio]|eukprot:XP_021326601.1 vegetative cell wall protein gp1-like [Danio rerio]
MLNPPLFSFRTPLQGQCTSDGDPRSSARSDPSCSGPCHTPARLPDPAAPAYLPNSTAPACPPDPAPPALQTPPEPSSASASPGEFTLDGIEFSPQPVDASSHTPAQHCGYSSFLKERDADPPDLQNNTSPGQQVTCFDDHL